MIGYKSQHTIENNFDDVNISCEQAVEVAHLFLKVSREGMACTKFLEISVNIIEGKWEGATVAPTHGK